MLKLPDPFRQRATVTAVVVTKALSQKLRLPLSIVHNGLVFMTQRLDRQTLGGYRGFPRREIENFACKTVHRTISRELIQACRPLCKVHGKAAAVVQVAMPFHPVDDTTKVASGTLISVVCAG